MATVQFDNLTTAAAFWPRILSIDITNNQPCQLATFSAEVLDIAGTMVFANRDEIRVQMAPDSVTFGRIFAGDLNEVIETDMGRSGPRAYRLTAQDYTKRLENNIIDVKRDTEESVTARVNWIMGHSTQGLTTTGVASISDLLDPRDYRGMSVMEALAEVAGEVGGSFYVDFDRVFHFFVTPPTVAAPFDLVHPADPPNSYPYWNYASSRASDEYAEGVYIKGDGVSGWVGTQGQYERAYMDESIKTMRKLNRVGARILADLSTSIRTVNVTLHQPGLEIGQTVHLTQPEWSIDEDFLVQSTSISFLTPNDDPAATEDEGGGKIEIDVTLVDQFTPCYLRSPSAKDVIQDDTGGDDGSGPDAGCIDCQRWYASRDTGDGVGIAFGGSKSVYTYDGTTMTKHACDGAHKWSATVSGSNVALFGHEPGSETPVLAFPYGIAKVDGSVLWSRSTEIEATAAVPMDRPRFWVVGEAESAGGGSSFPFQGYGTFEADYGPQSGPGATQSVIVWRCFIDSGAGTLSMAWDAGEIYKSLDAPPDAFAKLYWTQQASWTNPATPPTDSDIANWSEGPAPEQEHNIISTGGSYANPDGVATGWRPVSSNTHNFANHVTGRWLVIYSQSVEGESVFGATGLHLGFTMSGTRVLDCDPVGGGGGTPGPVLESRNSRTGALIASVDIPETTEQIRATPNSQYVFLLYSDNSFERYNRDLDLEDTVTITGFATGLQDWHVDDDYNIYRLAAEVLTKYNRDGEELWSTDLDAAEGYVYPTAAAGFGQSVIIDEHVRVAGVVDSQAVLLTVGRPFGNIRSIQKFKSGGTGALLAVGRNGECINVAGNHDGSQVDDDDAATDFLMRILAVRAE